MKQRKDQPIKSSLTPELKEKVDAYCAMMELTYSGFVRLAIKTFFDKREENEE